MQIEIILKLTTGKTLLLWECCFWCWGTLSDVSWGHFAYQIQAASSSWSVWLLASHSVPSWGGKIPAPGMAIVAQAVKPGLSLCMEQLKGEESPSQHSPGSPHRSPSKDNPTAHLGQSPIYPSSSSHFCLRLCGLLAPLGLASPLSELFTPSPAGSLRGTLVFSWSRALNRLME